MTSQTDCSPNLCFEEVWRILITARNKFTRMCCSKQPKRSEDLLCSALLKSKVTHWLSEWQCHLLSCPGQLKKNTTYLHFHSDYRQVAKLDLLSFYLKDLIYKSHQHLQLREKKKKNIVSFIAVVTRFDESLILKAKGPPHWYKGTPNLPGPWD